MKTRYRTHRGCMVETCFTERADGVRIENVTLSGPIAFGPCRSQSGPGAGHTDRQALRSRAIRGP